MHAYRISTDWQHNLVTWNQIIGVGNTLDTATNVVRDPLDPLTSAVGTCTLLNLESYSNYPRPYPCYYMDITQIVKDWLAGTYSNQGILIAGNDTDTRSVDIDFMNAGRTSSDYSRYFEPILVIVYNQ